MSDNTDVTPKRGLRILKALKEGHSVTAACRAQKVDRQTYYRWRKIDPVFAAAADAAIEAGTDLLEDAVMQRAIIQSDTLAIFLLKARRPEVYRERQTIDINLSVRKRAEQLAGQIGVPVDELMAEAEKVASGAWDSWSPSP